jgi:hypothetical protein
MKYHGYFRLRPVLIVVLLVASVVLARGTAPVVAQNGGGYDLTWNTIDGGGVTFSTGGSYSLGGSIGQPDAGVLSGGLYTLNGGFWRGAAVNYKIYLPLVVKNS